MPRMRSLRAKGRVLFAAITAGIPRMQTGVAFVFPYTASKSFRRTGKISRIHNRFAGTLCRKKRINTVLSRRRVPLYCENTLRFNRESL